MNYEPEEEMRPDSRMREGERWWESYNEWMGKALCWLSLWKLRSQQFEAAVLGGTAPPAAMLRLSKAMDRAHDMHICALENADQAEECARASEIAAQILWEEAEGR